MLKEQCQGRACALTCTRFGELFQPSAILNFALGMIQGKFTQKYALNQPLFCTFWFPFCLVWKILHCSCVFFASMDSEVGKDSRTVSFFRASLIMTNLTCELFGFDIKGCRNLHQMYYTLQESRVSCSCKSTCSRKRSRATNRGCPYKA